MDLPFVFKLVRRNRSILNVSIPAEKFELYRDFLNFFCGLKPLKWIGHSSHHKCFVCSAYIQDKIISICNKHIDTLPNLKVLIDFINGVDINEVLAFLRVGSIHRVDENLIKDTVILLNKVFIEQFYEVQQFGNEEKYFGHSKYSERKCRFCGESYPKVKFKDKNAHAIPDSLGNKLLFCYDECMTCNGKLSRTEKNLIDYLDFRRSEAQIPNKQKKIVTATGHNYIYNGEEKKLSITPYAIVNENDSEYFIKLESAIPISHLGIFRALAKIAICCTDDEEIIHDYRPLIDFINGNFIPFVTPDVWYVYREQKLKQPKITIYKRKTELGNLECPKCIICVDIIDLTFVYVLPFAFSDEGKYLTNEASAKFLQAIFEQIGGKNLEHIYMQDRIGKFSHVYMTVKKSDCKIIDQHQLDSVQEKPHNAIEFPPFRIENIIDEKILSLTIKIPYKHSSIDKFSLAKSWVESDLHASLIYTNVFRVQCDFKVKDYINSNVIFTVSALADAIVKRPDEVASHKHKELSSPLVEHLLQLIISSVKEKLLNKFPNFEFDELPSFLMELDGCVTKLNPNAEQTIMVKDKNHI